VNKRQSFIVHLWSVLRDGWVLGTVVYTVYLAWGNLANVLNANGRSLDAEHAYKAALRHRSNMADVHYNL